MSIIYILMIIISIIVLFCILSILLILCLELLCTIVFDKSISDIIKDLKLYKNNEEYIE